MSAIGKAARWFVTRPAESRSSANAVHHIEQDYRYPPRRPFRRHVVDAETRRQAMHLVGRR